VNVRQSQITLLIKINELIAFMCSVVNVTMLHVKKSDKIKSVVETGDIYTILNQKYGGSQNS